MRSGGLGVKSGQSLERVEEEAEIPSREQADGGIKSHRGEAMTAVKAVYEDGFSKPKEPVQLAEKTGVEVLIPTPSKPDTDDPTDWKAIDRLIGSVNSGLTEVAERHDEYLYGDPRE